MDGNDMSALGQIQKLDVREAWAHKAADFSPWLAVYPGDLGEMLGLDLEIEPRAGTRGSGHLSNKPLPRTGRTDTQGAET